MRGTGGSGSSAEACEYTLGRDETVSSRCSPRPRISCPALECKNALGGATVIFAEPLPVSLLDIAPVKDVLGISVLMRSPFVTLSTGVAGGEKDSGGFVTKSCPRCMCGVIGLSGAASIIELRRASPPKVCGPGLTLLFASEGAALLGNGSGELAPSALLPPVLGRGDGMPLLSNGCWLGERSWLVKVGRLAARPTSIDGGDGTFEEPTRP